MIRPLLLALAAAGPGLAQDADPSNQLLEGYGACALGEGLAEKTVTALGLYGWTHAEDSAKGVVTFRAGVGNYTSGSITAIPGECRVESTSIGTARALELIGYLPMSGQITIDATETDENGCTTVTFSNAAVALVTGGGTSPCVSDTDSAVAFYFAPGE